MKKKKKIIIICSAILVMLISFVLVFYFINKDKVNDDTDANMNFVINDNLEDGNNKKAKVFLLTGQSNA